MKQLFLALTVSTLVFTSCSSDDDNGVTIEETPNAVTAAFQAKFSNTVAVEFTKIGNDYEVDFDINTTDYEALYTNDGVLIKYKYDILLPELPQAIKKTIKTNYGNRMIDDTEILVQDDMTYYQLELENEPSDDKLVFNTDGTVNTNIVYWD